MTTPSGWYPDPQQPQQDRLWDGEVWTAYTRTRVPGTASDDEPDLTDSSAYSYLAPSAPAARRAEATARQPQRTAASGGGRGSQLWYRPVIWYVVATLVLLALFYVALVILIQ